MVVRFGWVPAAIRFGLRAGVVGDLAPLTMPARSNLRRGRASFRTDDILLLLYNSHYPCFGQLHRWGAGGDGEGGWGGETDAAELDAPGYHLCVPRRSVCTVSWDRLSRAVYCVL